MLPATRQWWESCLYPQPKQVLDLATPEGCKAKLTYITWKRTGLELNPRPLNRKSNALPLSHQMWCELSTCCLGSQILILIIQVSEMHQCWWWAVVMLCDMQAATVKKERELQKKLLKKERKTFRTVMKVSDIVCYNVSMFCAKLTKWMHSVMCCWTYFDIWWTGSWLRGSHWRWACS